MFVSIKTWGIFSEWKYRFFRSTGCPFSMELQVVIYEKNQRKRFYAFFNIE